MSFGFFFSRYMNWCIAFRVCVCLREGGREGGVGALGALGAERVSVCSNANRKD